MRRDCPVSVAFTVRKTTAAASPPAHPQHHRSPANSSRRFPCFSGPFSMATATLLRARLPMLRLGALVAVSSSYREELMDQPRIVLGSSRKHEKLLQPLTRRLEEVAHVDPCTTSFNPGTTSLDRLVELAQQ